MSKGLKNPVAVAAATTGTEMAIKGAPKAAKAAGQRADKINADTSGAFSWAILAMVVLGFYGVWRMTAPFRAGAGAATEAIDGVTQTIKNLFTEDVTTGGGNVSNLVDPNYKPPGATITVTQAATLAAQILNLFDSLGKLNESEKQQLYAIFLNKTAVDYQMIDAAFGRPYRNPIAGRVGTWLNGSRLNLAEWLNRELDPAGINFLKSITWGIF